MTINLFDENAIITEKVQNTADLFAAHIMDVAKNAENWASFLSVAGKMYKYSFVDQVLIHAQRAARRHGLRDFRLLEQPYAKVGKKRLKGRGAHRQDEPAEPAPETRL